MIQIKKNWFSEKEQKFHSKNTGKRIKNWDKISIICRGKINEDNKRQYNMGDMILDRK